MAKRRRLTIPAAKGPRLVERTPADLVVLGNRTDDPERIRAVIAEIERRAGAPYFQAELDRLRNRVDALARKKARVVARHANLPPRVQGAVTTKVGSPPPKVRGPSPAAAARIAKLAELDLREILQLWRNCVVALADGRRAHMHRDARDILEGIGREWLARRLKPYDPGEFFKWPSTDAKPGSGGIVTKEWLPEGMLQLMGYSVGRTSDLSSTHRNLLLSEVFRGQLPPAFPAQYMKQWGHPETAGRLRNMAETIAALTRNARRRRDSRMEVAIRHWEDDLRFLYDRFYLGKFQFGWPVSTV